jgi:[acyl-carrier-protein] S-malonyltransferase
MKDLSTTRLTQPAILVTSVIALRVREDVFYQRDPYIVAGHSLGEFTALVAARSLTFEQAVKMVTARGEYMEKAGEKKPGSMAALMKLDLPEAERICAEAGVEIANYNIGQTVISGTREGVLNASKLAKERHGLAIPLPVSIASHSSLMAGAQEKLQLYVSGEIVASPQVPIILNTTGRLAMDSDEILAEIPRQLTSSVLWSQTIDQMLKDGVSTFTEIGPGQVLSKMMKRIPCFSEDNVDNSDNIISRTL